jgi:hypothetical protein
VPHLSTIYSDQVASVAHRAGVDPTGLLGRAIAHEIGHVMREIWSQSELRRNNPQDWTFQESEARIMRAAVSSRILAAN